MAASVLPGAVAQLLAVSGWNEYNIVVYESEFGEIIICDDLTVLQVLSLPSSAKVGTISAAFNSETGSIAVASGTDLVIFEAIETFGRLPRWALSFNATDVPAISVGWLNKDQAAVTTISHDCLVWSVTELRTLWTERLVGPAGGRPVNVCSAFEAGSFCTQDASCLVKLWKRKTSLGTNVTDVFDFVYLRHTTNVCHCWFVSSLILATVTSETLFLWNTTTKNVVVSMPLPPETAKPLVIAESLECVLVLAASGNFWRIEVQNEDARPYTNKEERGFDSPPSPAVRNFYATSRRIYSVHVGSRNIGVYTNGPSKTVNIGCLTGVSTGGSSLSSYKNAVLAGRTIFAGAKRAGLVPEKSQVIMSCLAEKNTLLVTEKDSLVCYSNENTLLWSHTIGRAPLALAICKDKVALVYPDALCMVDLATGTEVIDERVQSRIACLRADRLLTWSKGVLRISSLSTLSIVQVAELELVDDDLNHLDITSLVLGQEIAAAVLQGSDNTGTTSAVLRVWTVSDCFSEVASITLKGLDVLSLAWSQDSAFLAVLATGRLLIFATSRSEGLVQVGETDTREWKPTKVDWTEDLSIVMYNGHQLLFQKPLLDQFGLDHLARFGIHGKSVTLSEAREALDADLPIYHPKVICEFLLALKPSLAVVVLSKLCRDLKFADVSVEGVSKLDPTLSLSTADLTAAVGHGISPTSPLWPTKELDDRLAKARLVAVSESDTKVLRDLARTLADAIQNRHMDGYALAYLGLQQLGGKDANSRASVYAWFSATKPELLSALDPLKDVSVGFWLDRSALADITEQRAKVHFAQERDPTEVSLPYVALRKKSLLVTLWRISAGHPEREKTMKFLNNDFTNERWRVASHKNAYALLSKHRAEYAAAFFLLGDSVVDCCQILVSKLHKVALAVTIARLYDGDSGQGMQSLSARCFSGDAWLHFWSSLLIEGDKNQVLAAFLPTTMSDPSAIFVYADQGGQFDGKTKKQWKAVLERRGFSRLVSSLLIDPLESKPPAPIPTSAPAPAVPEPDAGNGAGIHEAENSGGSKATDAELENRPLPGNLKPAPASLQLEPDMSAFGF